MNESSSYYDSSSRSSIDTKVRNIINGDVANVSSVSDSSISGRSSHSESTDAVSPPSNLQVGVAKFARKNLVNFISMNAFQHNKKGMNNLQKNPESA